ncbi:MAG: PKD domain-containing protein [Candidatus Nanopelagicales bacterium]
MKTVSRRARAFAALGATGALAAGLVVAVPTVAQAVASVGFSGQVQATGSISALGTAPTATKTQHKVWYAGGTWWASMLNQGSTGYSIHRLDNRETGTPVWTDTNVVIDSRNGTSNDAIYNASANKLFIASHVLTARNTDNVTANADAILTRYSLVDGTWSKDEGWPITIVASRGLSSLSIAQMTDGKIMATYVYNRRPYATNTNTTANGVNPPTFVNNFVVQWTKNFANTTAVGSLTRTQTQVAQTILSGDDVSAITAADGFVTIMFSNQRTSTDTVTADTNGDGVAETFDAPPVPGFYVARHRVSDSFGTGNFFGTQVLSGDLSADNHISLVTDPTSGLTSPVYAAVKTSLDQAASPVDSDPLLKVLKIQPRSGGTVLNSTNSGYVDVTEDVTVTTVADKGTRPVLSLDNTRRALDVFYAAPSDPATAPADNVIGVINHRAVNLTNFSLTGVDVVGANSANNAGMTLNKPDGQSDPSVSAQPVTSTTGTIVLSSDATQATANPFTLTRRYWFNDLFRAPAAAFTATIPSEVGNENGLKVQFTDTSLGKPTSWAWDFGDGATSTSENPTHTYATAGTKTVTLEVDNGFTTDSVVKTVVVGAKPTAKFTYKFPDKHRLLISLTDVSTGGATSATWDFGDKTSRTVAYPAGSTTVRHLYAKPGKYRVKLTVSNAVGSNWVAHPTTKATVSVYYFTVNATASKIAKPTRVVPTGKKVVLSWKAPNPRGLKITKYWAVCRATGSMKYKVVTAADFVNQIGRTRTATVTGLTAGKTYSCTIKAYNAKGWNLPSAPSSAFKARA